MKMDTINSDKIKTNKNSFIQNHLKKTYNTALSDVKFQLNCVGADNPEVGRCTRLEHTVKDRSTFPHGKI